MPAARRKPHMASTPLFVALAASAALSLSVARMTPGPAVPESAMASPRAAEQASSAAPSPTAQAELDKKVRAFLDSHKNAWHDLNVPEVDGQTLHDLIVKHKYTRALEIGTSTGHSGIWMAWALSKTGGTLITLEIDQGRRAQALENFKAAGLAHIIDSRLGDAHELTKTLPGPFDFVFSDADKDWYTNYLHAVWPKVTPGGCFTAHNVSSWGRVMRDFRAALEALPDGTTTIDRSSWSGLSITYKNKKAS